MSNLRLIPPMLSLAEGVLEASGLLLESELPPTFDELAKELVRIRAARSSLAQYEERITNALEELKPKKNTFVEGVGTLERMSGKTRRYSKDQHHDLAMECLKAARVSARRVDSITGEVLMEEGEALLHTLLDCAAISYWRKGSLAGLGIDIDDFAESTPGRVSFKVVS